jgi:HD-GYP domain-containing protein (c-di-GMP phosphodiesterase class II)
MRIVAVEELTADMELAREVLDPDTGRILLGAGTRGLPHYADRLRGMDVHYLYVKDDIAGDLTIPATIAKETRICAEQALDRIFEKCELDQQPDYQPIKQTVRALIRKVLDNREMLVNVCEMQCCGGDFLSHSVNVAVLSLLLANRLGYDADKMQKLGMGALLHDIGVAGMPHSLLKKRQEFTAEEKLLYEQHAVIGYYRVKESWEVSPLSRSVLLCHHERSDGSGYPRRLLKGDIHEFSRIVGLVDCLEELAGGHPFSRCLSIQEALEIMNGKARDWFDLELVKLFVDCIPACPTGTTVRLNDGRKAVVLAQNKGFPLRPVVRIFEDATGKRVAPGQEVDLLQLNHLVIM